MDNNNELTTIQLKDSLIKRFPDLKTSERTIGRARQELCWVHQTAKHAQLVREVNKGVRLDWAEQMIKENEQFDDVIFTDESSFQVEYNAKKAYRRIGEPRILRQRPKHPAKMHVWGGISKRGATQIVLFKTNMTATRYTSILDAALSLFSIPRTQMVIGSFRIMTRSTRVAGHNGTSTRRLLTGGQLLLKAQI